MARCCLVLGDQLSLRLSSLATLQPTDAILLAEVWSEATYVKHHPQKIVLTFAAMRHFADQLRAQGRSVHYVTLDDPENTQSLTTEMQRWQERCGFSGWVLTEPGEWRIREAFAEFEQAVDVPVEILEDTRFIARHAEFSAFLRGRKQPRMEHFYRVIRRKTGILMDGDAPIGGQWNYDAENREAFQGGQMPSVPPTPETTHLVDVKALVAERFAGHFGSLEGFFWPVTEAQAEACFARFLAERLPNFGRYQDALVDGEDTLFHSLISTSLHLGLLDPLTVCQRAEAEYHAGRAPLNAVEGFIRQILGWREYVRGLYWAYMPDYARLNVLDARAPLPAMYWDPEKTQMRCLQDAIRNTRDHAYAHHIQRLMVTGNFALLAGVSVEEVCAWYLAVYADAYEWVELPNTLGMALFADGGVMASKPYCASGKYIDRMSNYCGQCAYRVKETTGPRACPLNFLYWDFLIRHAERWAANPRMGMMMTHVKRMSPDQRAVIETQARGFLEHLAREGGDRDWRGTHAH